MQHPADPIAVVDPTPTYDCAPDCDERAACTSPGFGHSQCGRCPTHNQPRHHCGCLAASSLADSR